MYDWQKKILTDMKSHGKIYIDLPRGIGKRKTMNKEDQLKLDLDNIMKSLSDLDSLNNKLKVLGVEESPLSYTIHLLEKMYGAKQKELSDFKKPNINELKKAQKTLNKILDR